MTRLHGSKPSPEPGSRPEPTPDQFLVAVLLGSVIALVLGMLAAPLLRVIAEATLSAWDALLATFLKLAGFWAGLLHMLAHGEWT
jgi:hypothetical protein